MNEYGSIYGMSKEEFEKCKDKVFNEKATHGVVLDTVMLNGRLTTLNSLALSLKSIGRYGNMSVIGVESPRKIQKPDELIRSSTEKIEKSIVDSVIYSSIYDAGLSI